MINFTELDLYKDSDIKLNSNINILLTSSDLSIGCKQLHFPTMLNIINTIVGNERSKNHKTLEEFESILKAECVLTADKKFK